MAQFRAVIEGQRGSASRLGSKKSGISATVNGWDGGVRVVAQHTPYGDEFVVYATGGSNGHVAEQPLGMVTETGAWIPQTQR